MQVPSLQVAQPELVTTRLLLRPFVPEDAQVVELLAGAREIADTTIDIPHPYPPGAAQQWIDDNAAGWQKRTLAVFAITERATGRVVGAIGLKLHLPHGAAELGYWVGVPSWGRGYTTEAARAVVAFGFDTLGLHRIHAHCFARNASSERVLLKLGMTREGLLRDAVRKWGEFENVALYALLAPDWHARRDS